MSTLLEKPIKVNRTVTTSIEHARAIEAPARAKVVEILWKHPDRFQNIIPRLGVFHTICTLLSIIGNAFRMLG